MKKFFSICLLVFVTTICSAQSWYGNIGFGYDISLNLGENTNQTINANLGYFFDDNQAVELDYSHGFQKDFVHYNRIGANYLYEFGDCNWMVAPYGKLGIAYKNYGFRGYNEDFADVKLGLGVHWYINYDVSLNLGFDFTNSFNDEINFEWENVIMQINVGIAYYF